MQRVHWVLSPTATTTRQPMAAATAASLHARFTGKVPETVLTSRSAASLNNVLSVMFT